MVLHVTDRSESLITDCARVRPLTRVLSLVYFKVGFLYKFLSAQSAAVFLTLPQVVILKVKLQTESPCVAVVAVLYGTDKPLLVNALGGFSHW